MITFMWLSFKPVHHHANSSPTAAPSFSQVFGRGVWQIRILTDSVDSIGSNHVLLVTVSVTLGSDFTSLCLSFFL